MDLLYRRLLDCFVRIRYRCGRFVDLLSNNSLMLGQPGGQDSQIIAADLSTRVETNYLLQTHDDPPAFIIAKTQGWRTGPPDVLAALLDPQQAGAVDPSSYKFRLFIDLETGDERYREKVNCGMWVGSGMRKGAEVVYE
jgi:hypothetical protein